MESIREGVLVSPFSTLVAGYPHTWREVESICESVLASLFSTLVAGYLHTWREFGEHL